MTKHQTEVGSWHVDGHNMASVIRKTADGWETVARCPNENASWREDTRLMAAAPEMLEALKFFASVNALHEILGTHQTKGLHDLIAKATATATAA